MPTYHYETASKTCEGKTNHAEVVMEGCQGVFDINKPMSQSSREEKCRVCGACLQRNIAAEGAPVVKFEGPGFHVNEYKK
jgi:predicted nucleic acid-binding Zn ribbon protein